MWLAWPPRDRPEGRLSEGSAFDANEGGGWNATGLDGRSPAVGHTPSIAPTALTGQMVADAAPQVRNLHAAKPAQLADLLTGMRQGKTATQVASEVSAAHRSQLSAQQVGRINAAFVKANPPRDLMQLAERAGVSDASRRGVAGAFAPEAGERAAKAVDWLPELATDPKGAVKAAAKQLRQASDARSAEQIKRVMAETDPRVLYKALDDMRRMSPWIKAGERAWGATGAGLSAAAGQMVNEQFESDPQRGVLLQGGSRGRSMCDVTVR